MNLEIDNVRYGFERDQFGVGYWYCVRGHIPGMITKDNSNTIVPSMLGIELTKKAVELGVCSFDFFLNKEVTKEPVARVKSGSSNKKRGNVAKLLGAFNPFANHFSSVPTEANLDEQEFTEFEEIETDDASILGE